MNYITVHCDPKRMQVGGFGHTMNDILSAYIISHLVPNLTYCHSPLRCLNDAYHIDKNPNKYIDNVYAYLEEYDTFFPFGELEIEYSKVANLPHVYVNVVDAFTTIPLDQLPRIFNGTGTMYVLTNNNRVYLNEIVHLPVFKPIYKKLYVKGSFLLDTKRPFSSKKKVCIHLRRGDWDWQPLEYVKCIVEKYFTGPDYDISIYSCGTKDQLNEICDYFFPFTAFRSVQYEFNCSLKETMRAMYNCDILVGGQSCFPKIISVFSRNVFIYLPFNGGTELPALGGGITGKEMFWGTAYECFDKSRFTMTNRTATLNELEIRDRVSQNFASTRILLSIASDYVYERASRGSTYDKTYVYYLTIYLSCTPGWKVRVTHTEKDRKQELEQGVPPTLVYLYECDAPRPHFNACIDYAKSNDVPVLVISDDIFHKKTILNEPNTHRIDGIVSHMKLEKLQDEYKRALPGKYIDCIGVPFAESFKFTNWKLPKVYDICIYGTTELELPPLYNVVDNEYFSKFDPVPETYYFYPFRRRVANLLLKCGKYKIKYIKGTNLGCWVCSVRGSELSQFINQSYLSLSTRSRCDKCMRKYTEILASGTILLGNLPTDYRDVLKKYTVEITDTMTDDEILNVVDCALRDKHKLQLLGEEASAEMRSNYGMLSRKNVDRLVEITRTFFDFKNSKKS